jgi:5-methylcytosine-specific restriction protein B
MSRIAAEVSDLAWGHKYFSLLYPEKLDDFHNSDYQRFHLIKLLQVPPQDDGRYIAASCFVDLARVLTGFHSTTFSAHLDWEIHQCYTCEGAVV